MTTKTYGIKDAAKYLGVDEQYLRKLVREEKLPTTMVPVKAGSNVMKHQIAEADLDARKANAGHKAGGRSDGRNKWTLYATREEMAAIAKICADAGMPAPFMPNEGMYERRKAAKA